MQCGGHGNCGKTTKHNCNDGTAIASGSAAAIDYLDARSVLVDDLLDHRQAQAGAARLARDIGLKRAAQNIGRKSWSVVFDGEPDSARLGIGFLDLDQLGADPNARIGAAK